MSALTESLRVDRRIFFRLTKDYKHKTIMVLLLAIYDRKTYEEAGEVYGMSKYAVYQALKRFELKVKNERN